MSISVHEADQHNLPLPRSGAGVDSLYRRSAPCLLCLPALLIITAFFAACLYMFRFSVSAETGAIDGFSLQVCTGINKVLAILIHAQLVRATISELGDAPNTTGININGTQ